MAAMARCRICKAEFALARLLDDWSCCCPSCETQLAQDGSVRARILRKAAAVDRLEGQLVDTLSEIVATESNLELSIGPIVARILRDIDWQRQLEHDLSFAQRQVDQIRDALREWTTRLDTRADNLAAEQEGALPEDMHELAHRLRKVGDTLDRTPHSQTPRLPSGVVRAAARSLDQAAGNLASGRGRQSELAAALDDAADAIIATNSRDGDVPGDE
jgi:hypothetical protein